MQPVCREGLAAGHPPPQRSGGRSGDAESPRLWRGVEGGGGRSGQGHPRVLPGASDGAARPGPAPLEPHRASALPPNRPGGRCHPPLAGPGVWAGGHAASSAAKQSFVKVPPPPRRPDPVLRFGEFEEGFLSLPRGPQDPACAASSRGMANQGKKTLWLHLLSTP